MLGPSSPVKSRGSTNWRLVMQFELPGVLIRLAALRCVDQWGIHTDLLTATHASPAVAGVQKGSEGCRTSVFVGVWPASRVGISDSIPEFSVERAGQAMKCKGASQ